MAPSLVGEEKAKIGKTPTDVWWNTIVSPNGKEKTGYATQKPLGILNRIVRIHSNSGYRLGRNCLLVDNNPQAIDVMKKRFNNFNCIFLDDNNNEIITSTHSSDSLQGELL